MRSRASSSKKPPLWALLSLTANGLLILAVIWLLQGDRWERANFFSASKTKKSAISQKSALRSRHHLTYNKWLEILEREAKVAAQKPPRNLTVLAGDSLSLWFPPDLLPPARSWLNQGISGEISAGLFQRLKLFDGTEPSTIFVMIGINDSIRGLSDEMILNNYRLIIRRLRRVHPKSQIVVQSILPYRGESLTLEGRDRLLAISNSRIREFNRQLGAVAKAEDVKYLDLHPLFTDERGNLRAEFTTDGLHLSRQGYLVWSAALQMYDRLELN